MRYAMITTVLAATLFLGGCANSDYGMKESAGGFLGGAAGALAGAQFGKGRGQLAATAAGALIGAFLGSSAGRSLDRADRLYARRAEYKALEYQPTGRRTVWRNPNSGNHGVVTPMSSYRAPSGSYCREYQHTVYIGGQLQEAYGRACRQPDGSWRVAN